MINLKDLPNRTSERDLLLLTYAEQGNIQVDWIPVSIGALTVWMTRDAVRWKSRLSVSAVTQQRIADLLDALMLTPKLADNLAAYAAKEGGLVGPFTRGDLGIKSDAESMSTTAMIKHSRRIDIALPKDYIGPVCGWKQKCISQDTFRKPGKSTNYGWWLLKGAPAPAPTRPSETRPDLVVIQGPYEAHSATTFADYSEFVSLVRKRAVYEGREIDLSAAYTGKLGPDILKLVSHEGALPSARRPDVPLDHLPPTKLGDRGAAVTAWQRRLIADGYGHLLNPPDKADGIHGPATEQATLAWLRDNSFERVDNDPEFIQARNYTPAGRKPENITFIILHSTENKIRNGVAKRVAQWFAGDKAPKASAHYVVGPDEVIQCVKLKDIAWAAPGANRQGVQIEQVGLALHTDWLTEGRPVLERSAKLVARLCEELEIPVRRLGIEEVRAHQPGITTHATVTDAFHKSDHQDPGGRRDKHWPWDEYLQMVKSA